MIKRKAVMYRVVNRLDGMTLFTTPRRDKARNEAMSLNNDLGTDRFIVKLGNKIINLPVSKPFLTDLQGNYMSYGDGRVGPNVSEQRATLEANDVALEY